MSPWGQLGEIILGQGPLIDWIRKSVYEAVRSGTFTTPENVPLGVIPCFQQNAFSIRPPCGGAVVCIDLNLGLVLYWVAAGFMEFCRSANKGIQEDIIGLALSAYAKNFNTIRLKTLTLDKVVKNPEEQPDFNVSLSLIQVSLIMFVFMHELAHCALGHLEGASTRRQVLPFTRNVEVDVYEYLQRHELEADEQAIRWLAKWILNNEEISNQLASCVCYLLFGYFWVIDHLYPVSNTKERTHPHSGLRFKRSKEILREEGCFGLPPQWLPFYYDILKAIETGDVKSWDLPPTYWS